MATASVGSQERRLRARPHTACFVCGQDNPAGLKVAFRLEQNGIVTASWTPATSLEGFRGIVHGGVVSTVLDEAMSKAIAATGREALTAELRIRFRQPVHSGSSLSIRGWIVRRTKRLIETEASLTGPGGAEHAHGWASFLSLPEGQS